MAIDLYTPTPTDFMKDFPARHEVAMNVIDDYAGPCLTTHALPIHVPVFASVGGTLASEGTNPTKRDYYYKIFDNIYVWGEFRFGTSASGGASNTVYTVTLPFNVDTTLTPSTNIGTAPIVGEGCIFEDGSANNRFPLTVHLRTNNVLMFGFKFNSGQAIRELGNPTLITWSAADGFTWNARFKRLP